MGEEGGEEVEGGGGAGLGCGWRWWDGRGEWDGGGGWLRWVRGLQAEALEGRGGHGGGVSWIWVRGGAGMPALVIGAGLDGGGVHD